VVAYPLLDARPESLSGSAAEVVGADLSLDSPRSIRAAVELVRREHVRAVWLVDRPVVSPAYALLHGAGVRRVVVHDHSSGARRVRHGLRGLAKRLATRLPWASADAVIAVSDYVGERQRTAGGVPADRIHVVPNPVSVPGTVRPRGEVRAALGLRPGRRLVAAAGRLTVEKGFADLLAAADSLPDDVDVLVFGDGPERARLEEQRAGLRTGERVRLAGQRPDAAELVAAADVCVVPSRWEEAFCRAARGSAGARGCHPAPAPGPRARRGARPGWTGARRRRPRMGARDRRDGVGARTTPFKTLTRVPKGGVVGSSPNEREQCASRSWCPLPHSPLPWPAPTRARSRASARS
jgi:hypothetical protein